MVTLIEGLGGIDKAAVELAGFRDRARAAGAGDLHLNGVLCMERMDRGKLSRAGRVDGHGISPGNRDSTSLTPGPDNWSSVALQHVGITVSDVDASVRFWSAFLGRRPRARARDWSRSRPGAEPHRRPDRRSST